MIRWAPRVAIVAALAIADRALAHLAVDMNAAGALLSPGGASVGALAVAALFLATRLGLSLSLCLLAALGARGLVRRLWSSPARRRAPER